MIEQGISDTLCSMDTDLIFCDILDQVEVFFQYLDRHVIDDIGLWDLGIDKQRIPATENLLVL